MDKQNRKSMVDAYKERVVVGGVWAVKNAKSGKLLLGADANLNGAKNKFGFFTATGVCPYLELSKDWEAFGKDAFAFEVLEEIRKKPEQSDREFKEDLETLREMWGERIGAAGLY